MSKLNKIAVIGSNSFSGASFVNYALSQGAEVVGFSRSAQPHDAFLPYRWGAKEKPFQFYQYDLNHHLDDIMRVLSERRIGMVVNFAAQSMVGQSWDYPEHWFETNVVSSVKLHNRLRQSDFLDRYLHVTTPEVYGSTEGFVTEDAPFRPSTPYAVSRAAADMSLQSFFQAYQFPVLYTRAANVYGPGQQLYRIIPRTILYIRTGKTLQLHGGGHAKRNFIHIDDVCSATWRILSAGALGECYHISGDEIITVRALVERICQKMEASFDACAKVADERLGKDAAYMLDSSKLRTSLGWSDKITLDAGLNQCIDWVERYLPVLKEQPQDYIHKA